ncbi:MAG: YjgN family protein [Alphaproteobacteria bacterium]|nr:YjgN family protein [Alphaproteobacteria bacterium]
MPERRQNTPGPWDPAALASAPELKTPGLKKPGLKTQVRHDLAFTGDLSSFYRIWLVNTALTIVTLGLYGPWATVRTKRYLFGHTRLIGTGFTFEADPRAILKGRLILLGTLATGAFLPTVVSELDALLLFALAMLVGIPWLVSQSAKFRARNTTWRGVHFDFTGGMLGAMPWFVLLYLALPFTLGLIYPYIRKRQHAFLINNLKAGGRSFETDPSGFSYFGSTIKALVVGVVFVLAPALFVGHFINTQFGDPTTEKSAATLVLLGLASLLPLFSYLSINAVYRAYTRNILFAHTSFDGVHKLHSDIDPLKLGWITLTNLAATLLTLGFFRPVALLRKHRYLVTTMGITLMEPVEGLDRMMTRDDNALGDVGGNYFGTGVDI